MKKKIVGIFVCTLLIVTVLPTAVLSYEEKLEKTNVQHKSDLISDFGLFQLDWYVDGEMHTRYSSWGRMDIDVIPDPNDVFYMNVVGIALYEPAWVIQNYPILPESYGVPDAQAIHFNIQDLGLYEGDQLQFMETLITTTLAPLQEPPSGDFYDVLVNTLIRDAWGHDNPPVNVGAPVGHRAANAVVNITQHENVPSVQEAVNNCITGSYARSIKWLDNEYDLANLNATTTGQDVYDNLTGLGVGHGTGMGKTEDEMLTLKADYLYGLDNRTVTKFVDYGYLGNVQNATEVTTGNLSQWLADELETEDIEMCYDGHCVCITGMYKQGNKTFLRYRDDERQGNDSAGDNRTKSGELVNDSGTWKFKGSKVDYVVSESINNPPDAPDIDGPTSGLTGTSYNYTFNSVDPKGENVYYYILWGEGHVEVWDGPYDSGEDFEIAHTYLVQGTFTIKAKAKDIYDAESEWGELVVTMPRNKVITSSLLLRLFERFPNAFPLLRYILGL